MSTHERKWPALDIVKLYNESSHDMWNRWLTYCLESHNIEELKKIRYGIQVGMDKAVKDKMNTEPIVLLFIKLNRSIERTLKDILKAKHPCKNDNSLLADPYDLSSLAIKRLRDEEFDKFLKESAF